MAVYANKCAKNGNWYYVYTSPLHTPLHVYMQSAGIPPSDDYLLSGNYWPTPSKMGIHDKPKTSSITVTMCMSIPVSVYLVHLLPQTI